MRAVHPDRQKAKPPMIWTDGMLCVFAALLLDALMGEPDALWRRIPHPAVLMGRFINRLDLMLNSGGDTTRRLAGVAALLIMVLTAGMIGWAVSALPFGWVFEILLAAILIAQRSLCDHVAAVAAALRRGLADARSEVAKIVGRDTAALDETGVARAAIESGAENFSDGVVAPVFWLVIGGLPGLLIYKMVNTADSMIGYRNDKYLAFGWASARFDDLLNLVPSRFSALLIAVQAFSLTPLRAALRDAGLHRSPNAGWPEAATAAAQNIALSGPRIYEGRRTDDPYVWAEGRHALYADDVQTTVRHLWRSWAVMAAAVIVIALI